MISKIYYTETDESPALATCSFLPIIKAFVKHADITVESKDISLAGRIIAGFPDNLTENQKTSNDLSELAELTKNPSVNIIKLPNISASVPQLKAVLNELQEHGYDIPDYPENPKTDEEKKIKERFLKILGSAVNPVLRQGNSDRHVAEAVKKYAKANPHPMGRWESNSKSHVASMQEGDFYSTEKSLTIKKNCRVKIELITASGEILILREKISLLKDEIIDAAVMNCRTLCDFYKKEMDAAKNENVLLSLHLKTTMMKISDPIMFGHAVKVYYKDVFDKYEDIFSELGVEPNNGLIDIYSKINILSNPLKTEIETAIQDIYKTRPPLAMVNSEKGITNLHIPGSIIIDASMPAAIRFSGKMKGPDGKLHDMKAMIPDRCYAGIYQETINFCKQNGAFDVAGMGSVSNIGLMAQKAEEYGSHDKTFEIPSAGVVRIINDSGEILIEHIVEKGDIWRMCQTKDIPVKNWIKLAVDRAIKTKNPAVFWLDKNRAHDKKLIKKVIKYLKDYNTEGIDIKIMEPAIAVKYTLQRSKEGKDTISITGNVLRDYLTDLFPVLELGVSSKMLSIVPLLAGGGLYETGAGGTAPDLYKYFLEKNHLSWDSLGEYLALAVSLKKLAEQSKNNKIQILAEALDKANDKFLQTNKAPSGEVKKLDNRGSSFYLAMYWAQAITEQEQDIELKIKFEKIAEELSQNEEKILKELNSVQGYPVDTGGYYYPDRLKINEIMRPSMIFNKIIDNI